MATTYFAVFTAATTPTWARADIGNGRNGWSATGYAASGTDATPPTTTTSNDEPGTTLSGLSAGTAYKLWAIWDDGATSSNGPISSSEFIAVALSGQSATASAGTLAPSVSVSLSGSAVTSSAGTLAPSITIALSGQAVTASAGTITATQGITAALSGQEATASAGTVEPSLTIALTGQAVTASAGTITYSSGSNLTLSLGGQEVTASAGTLAPSASVPLSGQSAAASAGTLAPEVSKALAGQSLTASAGTLTYSANQDLTIALTGQSVSVEAGVITATGGITAVSLVGAPGRKHQTYVVHIDGERFVGTQEEIQALIDDFTAKQVVKAEKTLKAPKKARIVVNAGKPAEGKAEKPAAETVLAVQAEVRSHYSEVYAKALQDIQKVIESARLAEEDDDEVMLLL